MKIETAVNRYGEYRKSLGEHFRVKRYVLLAFAKHVGFDTEMSVINRDQCIEYLYLRASNEDNVTSYWFDLYNALNDLFTWSIQRGIILSNPLPFEKPQKPAPFIPYIYSLNELKLLFDNALTYRKRFNIVFLETIQAILRLIYVLGLRPSEPLKLCLSDIRLGKDNFVIIRETKFYKSRIVPFNEKIAEILSEYLQWRKMVHLPQNPDDFLFLTRKYEPIKLSCLQQAFRQICNKAGIKRNDKGRIDVRLHDLRHSFATHRITNWYREGREVQRLLPVLATYMGHCSISSTSVYISFTDALLHEANIKFESYVRL